MLDFEEIKKWFDYDKWDVGYLTKDQLKICSYSPIKNQSSTHGWIYINGIQFDWMDICNGIVLIRHDITFFDYSLYDEATEAMSKSGLKEFSDWGHVYTNFKEAEILSGRGVRARNSLVYNYRFGFDSKVCVIGFMEMIQNPPKIKRVAGNNFKEKFWHQCIGCDACREVCPVGAIHNNEGGPYWLDSQACNNFLEFSDHPKIPSMKKYWHKNISPETPKELVDKVTTAEKNTEMGDGQGTPFLNWNAKGYTHDPVIRKNGKMAIIPQCRECQTQPPCSTWDGKYPYEDYEEVQN